MGASQLQHEMSHSFIARQRIKSLVGCDTVPFREWFPTFRRIFHFAAAIMAHSLADIRTVRGPAAFTNSVGATGCPSNRRDTSATG